MLIGGEEVDGLPDLDSLWEDDLKGYLSLLFRGESAPCRAVLRERGASNFKKILVSFDGEGFLSGGNLKGEVVAAHEAGLVITFLPVEASLDLVFRTDLEVFGSLDFHNEGCFAVISIKGGINPSDHCSDRGRLRKEEFTCSQTIRKFPCHRGRGADHSGVLEVAVKMFGVVEGEGDLE